MVYTVYASFYTMTRPLPAGRTRWWSDESRVRSEYFFSFWVWRVPPRPRSAAGPDPVDSRRVPVPDVQRLVRDGVEFVGQPAEVRRFDLTLGDAIQRALDRNLDIAVERINPQVFDLTLAQQQAFYRPTFGFNVDATSRTNPSATQLDGGDVTETDTSNFDVNLSQPMRWGGGALTVGFDNNRQETTNAFFVVQPQLSKRLRVAIHATAASRLPRRQHSNTDSGNADQP